MKKQRRILMHPQQHKRELKTLKNNQFNVLEELRKNVKQFFLFTTLHGFKYLGENRSFIDK